MKQQTVTLRSIAGIAACLLLSSLLPSCKNNAYQEQLEKAVEDINKKTPMMVDDQTRLDSARAGTDNEIKYYYTLPNISSADLDKKVLEDAAKPGVLQSIKTDISMKPLRDHDTKMTYTYYDMNGESLMDFSFTKDDYKDAK